MTNSAMTYLEYEKIGEENLTNEQQQHMEELFYEIGFAGTDYIFSIRTPIELMSESQFEKYLKIYVLKLYSNIDEYATSLKEGPYNFRRELRRIKEYKKTMRKNERKN